MLSKLGWTMCYEMHFTKVQLICNHWFSRYLRKDDIKKIAEKYFLWYCSLEFPKKLLNIFKQIHQLSMIIIWGHWSPNSIKILKFIKKCFARWFFETIVEKGSLPHKLVKSHFLNIIKHFFQPSFSSNLSNLGTPLLDHTSASWILLPFFQVFFVFFFCPLI